MVIYGNGESPIVHIKATIAKWMIFNEVLGVCYHRLS